MRGGTFDYFVIFAGMRTGSNLLEEKLAGLRGVETHGELFNPHFIGNPSQTTLKGKSQKERDADPVGFLDSVVRAAKGLPGFRLFRDHDPRMIEHVLNDRRAAKILLSRNPLESFVSLKIAQKTGQWWMGDARDAKVARMTFDAEDFARFMSEHSEAERLVRRTLQITGQTGFEISYEDLSDADVIAGAARFLGADPADGPAKSKAKVQNPSALSDKVTNFRAMKTALGELDPLGTDRWPNFEPPYLPGLKAWRVGAVSPLVFAPVANGTGGVALAAMESLDKQAPIPIGTQPALRNWKRKHPGHRSFTIIRHPVERAWDTFCRHIRDGAPEPMERVRDVLKKSFEVDLSGDPKDTFLKVMVFAKANLRKQTALAPRPAFGSQSLLIEAISRVMPPDLVIRLERFEDEFPTLLASAGVKAPEDWTQPAATGFKVPALAEIYDKTIETAVKSAYPRDYMMFGYGRWDQAA